MITKIRSKILVVFKINTLFPVFDRWIDTVITWPWPLSVDGALAGCSKVTHELDFTGLVETIILLICMFIVISRLGSVESGVKVLLYKTTAWGLDFFLLYLVNCNNSRGCAATEVKAPFWLRCLSLVFLSIVDHTIKVTIKRTCVSIIIISQVEPKTTSSRVPELHGSCCFSHSSHVVIKRLMGFENGAATFFLIVFPCNNFCQKIFVITVG